MVDDKAIGSPQSNETKNNIGGVIADLQNRVADLEKRLEAMDRVLTAMLPRGSRVIPVEDVGDVVYVPYEGRY